MCEVPDDVIRVYPTEYLEPKGFVYVIWENTYTICKYNLLHKKPDLNKTFIESVVFEVKFKKGIVVEYKTFKLYKDETTQHVYFYNFYECKDYLNKLINKKLKMLNERSDYLNYLLIPEDLDTVCIDNFINI